MNEQLIQDRLASLTPEYRSFVESEFANEASTSFGSVHNFTERQTEILENAIWLYFLFFLNEEESINFISQNCELPPEEAKGLFTSIQSILPGPVITVIKIGYQTLNNQNSDGSEKLADEIEETEREFAAIQGIRTMAADMQHVKNPGEVVHSSSQSELLNRNAPTQSKEPSNRWETDR